MATEPLIAPDGGIDPTVALPKHVRDAAAASEAAYAAAYPGDPPPNPDAPLAPPVTATVTNQDPPPPQPDPALAPPPPQPDFTAPATPAELKDNDWAGRYNSMRGRWEASQRQLGVTQQQVADLAVELERTQELLSRAGAAAPKTPNPDTTHKELITQQDRDTYGDELLDTVTRAARSAVEPELDALRSQNQELQKRVITTGQRDAKAELTRAVPNWVAINRSPEFNGWLSLPNPYTGAVRRQMLQDAYSSANAQMMVTLFKDFLTEVKATGGVVPGGRQQEPQPQPQVPQPPAAPHQAAIDPLTLAAPGRARPASSDPSQMPADKPFYTRAQIAANYANKRRGLWAGRETEWAALEADMFAAGRENRVR